MKLRKIEILENDTNKKGDLFSRLMIDFFHTIGYDQPRFDVQKTGREVDINCKHRTEKKIAIAECKAHSDKIGGSDINKFIGVIDIEKRKLEKDAARKDYNIIGYFISLSGFKETAIEQEKDADDNRVILIKPEKIVEELINGRILVSIEKGLLAVADISKNYTLIEEVDLLAYENGWVWTFYFSDVDGQKTTHFALVHGGGSPLIKELAEDIIAKDDAINKIFDGKKLLNNKYDDKKLLTSKELENNISESPNNTKNKYFKYLENELGEIQFEGMPTDKEAGSVRVKLENIFVPLHLIKSTPDKNDDFSMEKLTRKGIGKILGSNNKLAILAKPGGGKSTLIKRIAIAYAFPKRRKEINDELPDKDWFPIFLRCRDIEDKINLSITEIISSIPSRAEINYCLDDFNQLVSDSLQSGKALLLIDGLDEISEDKNRIAFVNQLRTFIATYPSIGIVITSREAGFRVVAGSIATYCENYRVSNLIEPEIEALSVKWHKAIIDDSENTIKEAKKVSEIIIRDARIKVLAENPLLLTTLLFVKRWAGYIPTKRSVLYQEMIKLLLVTWNVEGHEQLDIEETEPQLAYVAYWMTKNGQQTITEEELKLCLIESRKQMPEILGYTKISPADFIKRVEFRSSLLIMSGHRRLESGHLVQIYEFLHLSFQEYLTAKAIVKRFVPQYEASQKMLDIIKPNVNNVSWKEVIPLTAVLLERDTKELIEFLIDETKKVAETETKRHTINDELIPWILGSCLANEIQINPEILDKGIEWYARCSYKVFDKAMNEVILKSKFGSIFRNRIKTLYSEEYNDKFASEIGAILSEIYNTDLRSTNDYSVILKHLKSNSKEDQCAAILGLMGIGWEKATNNNSFNPIFSQSEDIFKELLTLLKKDDPHLQFAICWTVAWCAESDIMSKKMKSAFINYIIIKWVDSNKYNLKRMASWALTNILEPDTAKEELIKNPKLKLTIKSSLSNSKDEFDELASVYLSYIISIDIDEKKATEVFSKRMKQRQDITKDNNFLRFAKVLNIDIETLKKEKEKELNHPEEFL